MVYFDIAVKGIFKPEMCTLKGISSLEDAFSFKVNFKLED